MSRSFNSHIIHRDEPLESHICHKVMRVLVVRPDMVVHASNASSFGRQRQQDLCELGAIWSTWWAIHPLGSHSHGRKQLPITQPYPWKRRSGRATYKLKFLDQAFPDCICIKYAIFLHFATLVIMLHFLKHYETIFLFSLNFMCIYFSKFIFYALIWRA